MRPPLLSLALVPGAAYFFLVAAAHTVGWHLPGAYVFFDIPSTEFQDRIIGLLAFGWGVQFLDAARRCRKDPRASITGLLVSGGVALVALSRIAATTDFRASVPEPQAGWYWVQIGGLAVYLAALLALSRSTSSAARRSAHGPVRAP